VTLCVLNHVALSGARVALALQALGLGVPSIGVALMLAPFALTSTLAALPLGRWVDRIGARRPALIGMAITTAALAAAAWHPTAAVLLASATIIGLGYAASLIALQGELGRDRGERERVAGFAAFAIGTAASGGFGPFLAGQCMARAGATLAFGALALLSLAAFAGAASQARRMSSSSDTASTSRTPLFSRSTLRGLPGLRRLLIADLLMAFAWNANTFAVPLVAQRQHWSADVVGDLLGCFGAAVLLVRARPAAARARGDNWRVIARALFASGAVLALLPFATPMPWSFALEALLGAGLGCALPSVLALADMHTPAGRRAEVLGLRQAVLGLGAATMPTTLGALVGIVGLAPALAGFGGALLAAAATIAPRGERVSAGRSASARHSACPAGRRSRDGARRCPR
jgi:MFS family permease